MIPAENPGEMSRIIQAGQPSPFRTMEEVPGEVASFGWHTVRATRPRQLTEYASIATTLDERRGVETREGSI